MGLTPQQARRLDEVNTEIASIERRLAVSHGLGDSHSSQGISATFNQNIEWSKRLPLLRNFRDRLECIRDGLPLPPVSGTNLSYYFPTQLEGANP